MQEGRRQEAQGRRSAEAIAIASTFYQFQTSLSVVKRLSSMKHEDRTKEKLLEQIAALQQRVHELEGLESRCRQQEQVLSQQLTQEQAARHEAEQALQASNKQLAEVFEILPDALICVDSQWRYTVVNSRAEVLLGKSRAELLGRSAWDVFPFLIETQAYTLSHQAIAHQEPIEYEEFYPEFDKWFSIRLYPSPEGLSAYFRDITEQRRAEATLRQTEERLSLILRATNDVIYDCNLQTGNVWWNDAYNENFGKRPLDLPNPWQWWLDRIHPEERDAVVASLRSTLEGTSDRWVAEYRYQGANGTYANVIDRTCIVRDETGKAIRLLGTILDLTEQKQAEAALRQQAEALENQQKWLEAILDLMPTPTVFVEPGTARVTFANKIANELAGGDLPKNKSLEEYAAAYYCTDANGERIPTEQMPAVVLARGEQLQNYEMHWHTPGGIRATLCWGEMLPAMYGHPAICIGMFQDVTRLKEIEENLRQTEERLRIALTSAQMIAWDVNLKTNYVLCSENAPDVWGIQSGSHEDFFAIVHPGDRTNVIRAYECALSGEISYTQEYRIISLDGQVRWLHSQGRVYLDVDGQPERISGISVDITERKQAEADREQLLAREQAARAEAEKVQRQLSVIFETSPVGIGLLNYEQRFVAINESLAEINGLSREQHLGHTIPELFGESDPDLVELFHRLYTTGEPFISPQLAVNVPGRDDRRPGYYNVYYLPIALPSGQVEEVLVYVVDVTERVRLERSQEYLSEVSAVLASSLDYQTTLEQVAQLTVPELADWCTVHIVEEDGSIEQIAVAHVDPAKIEWPHQIREKYPLNRDDVRGAALTLRTGEPDLVPYISDEMLVQAARDSEHLKILRQVGFKSVMAVPLRTQERILGVISFVAAESGRRYDQADLRLAQELARRASLAIENAQLYRTALAHRAQAEAANRVKDEFLAVLSHELRTPLNPILGWTKLLRAHRLDASKTAFALGTIERNAQLQAQLIEDLLDISGILQGKLHLKISPVDLVTTIEAAVETVRLSAEAKSIQLHVNLTPLIGQVLGNSDRLQQVIWNLLSNAIKFTPKGGRVDIRLERVGTQAQITVSDTGKGINPDFLPYAFEAFRQADGKTTRMFGGLGLGLSIARHLVELHGGTIRADSAGEGQGATFTVQLPLMATDSAAIENSTQTEQSLNLSGIRVLLVDDDRDNLELLTFILEQSKAVVSAVTSAKEALDVLAQFKPDILVSDIGMPEMDGYTLMRQVRLRASEGQIPAIALTAYVGEVNQQQALGVGFQIHIPKPVEPEKLLRAMANLVG